MHLLKKIDKIKSIKWRENGKYNVSNVAQSLLGMDYLFTLFDSFKMLLLENRNLKVHFLSNNILSYHFVFSINE